MVNLPTQLLTQTEVNKLNQEDKRRYFRQFLFDVLKNNPDGISIGQLVNTLKERKIKHSPDTLRKYLNYMVLIRDAYVVLHGNTEVYHINGKMPWDSKRKILQIGNKKYSVFEISNVRGDFIFIQEREKDSFNIDSVTGGIIIKKENLHEFISILEEFVNSGKGVNA